MEHLGGDLKFLDRFATLAASVAVRVASEHRQVRDNVWQ